MEDKLTIHLQVVQNVCIEQWTRLPGHAVFFSIRSRICSICDDIQIDDNEYGWNINRASENTKHADVFKKYWFHSARTEPWLGEKTPAGSAGFHSVGLKSSGASVRTVSWMASHVSSQ